MFKDCGGYEIVVPIDSFKKYGALRQAQNIIRWSKDVRLSCCSVGYRKIASYILSYTYHVSDNFVDKQNRLKLRQFDNR